LTPGTLYVVATPIGNLEDITLRALRVLKEVGLVACEDTRRTRTLLTHFGIHVPVTSYFEHNKLAKGPAILKTLREGKSVALVTDAGTPGISDPGFLLVREAREAGIPVVPVPGPSAVVAALSAAGIPADSFVFGGFLPVKPGKRIHRLEALRDLEMTLVCYESPHRILAALEAIGHVFGQVEIVVARELTKQFEEIVRGTPAALRERFAAGTVRGEFTLVIPYTKSAVRGCEVGVSHH
jgi:16S rRNA (cytidine1402-2'-O)-methyltransferase